MLGYDTRKNLSSFQPDLAIFAMRIQKLWYSVLVLVLRVTLVTLLVVASWFVYTALPPSHSAGGGESPGATTVQIVLRQHQKTARATDGLILEIYPIDIVAVRHEFFAERRAGERFDDFLKQRMKGRAPLSGRFDVHGQATVALAPGNWWIHATLPGDEELEWRLRVTIGDRNQIVELTPLNAYLRSKSF
jgi:hypothetical protein